MTKRKTKTAKRKPKAKPIGEGMLWQGNVYVVTKVDTLQNGRFEQVTMTAVRYLPIS